MSPYCTLDDLIARYGQHELDQLARDPVSGQIDTARIERALADAAGQIDAHAAAAGCPLPLTPVPAFIATLAADLARYRLYDDQPTPAVKQRYDDAQALLSRVATGKLSLGVRNQAPASAGGVAMFAESRQDWRDGRRRG